VLVDVDGGEVEGGVAEDGVLHLHVGSPFEFGAEEGDGLGMGAAEGAAFDGADVVAEVGDEVDEGLGGHFGLGGVDLVPEVPGEEGSGRAPALGGEGEAGFDGGAHGGGEEGTGGVFERAAAGAVVGMVVEFEPHPEGVEWGEEDAEAVLFGEGEEVVPVTDHVGRPAAGGGFEVAVTDLGVLEHEAHAGDAVGGEVREVALDGGDVFAAEEGVELAPADGVVLADGVPGLAVFGLEVGDVGDGGDPGEGLLGAWEEGNTLLRFIRFFNNHGRRFGTSASGVWFL